MIIHTINSFITFKQLCYALKMSWYIYWHAIWICIYVTISNSVDMKILLQFLYYLATILLWPLATINLNDYIFYNLNIWAVQPASRHGWFHLGSPWENSMFIAYNYIYQSKYIEAYLHSLCFLWCLIITQYTFY